jgi:hypothetical protein
MGRPALRAVDSKEAGMTSGMNEAPADELFIRLDLDLARTFDRFTAGLAGIILILYANPFLAMSQFPYARFLYLFPVWFTAASVLNLNPRYLADTAWEKAVWRIRWSAIAMAGLAPFWAWWQVALDSRFCIVNLALLCFSLFLFLFNLVGAGRILAEKWGEPWLALSARFTRMAVIYLLIAPVMAFFVTVWYGNNSGHDILSFMQRISWWKRHLLTLPILLTIMICWQLSRLHPHRWQWRKDLTT